MIWYRLSRPLISLSAWCLLICVRLRWPTAVTAVTLCWLPTLEHHWPTLTGLRSLDSTSATNGLARLATTWLLARGPASGVATRRVSMVANANRTGTATGMGSELFSVTVYLQKLYVVINGRLAMTTASFISMQRRFLLIVCKRFWSSLLLQKSDFVHRLELLSRKKWKYKENVESIITDDVFVPWKMTALLTELLKFMQNSFICRQVLLSLRFRRSSLSGDKTLLLIVQWICSDQTVAVLWQRQTELWIHDQTVNWHSFVDVRGTNVRLGCCSRFHGRWTCQRFSQVENQSWWRWTVSGQQLKHISVACWWTMAHCGDFQKYDGTPTSRYF